MLKSVTPEPAFGRTSVNCSDHAYEEKLDHKYAVGTARTKILVEVLKIRVGSIDDSGSQMIGPEISMST